RRRHTRSTRDWSSDVCSSDLLHSDAIHPVTPIDYAGVELTTFHNSFPSFTDTNNLSVVSFLQYDNYCICIPGDMEIAGWQELLRSEERRVGKEGRYRRVGES